MRASIIQSEKNIPVLAKCSRSDNSPLWGYFSKWTVAIVLTSNQWLAIGCSSDSFTPMTALGIGQQQMRAMATRAPTLHETTQHSIGLMLIWSFIAVTVVVTAFPFIAVFHWRKWGLTDPLIHNCLRSSPGGLWNQLPLKGGALFLGFIDEVDAASGARSDWRRDPYGDDRTAGAERRKPHYFTAAFRRLCMPLICHCSQHLMPSGSHQW